MKYVKLSASDYRTIALSLIAIAAIVLALIALFPLSDHGSSGSIVEGATVSPGDNHGQWNPSVLAPSSAPQASNQQIEADSPATIRECKEELAAGRAVLCKRNSFSVKTIRSDGGYSIDWSVWAGRHSDVDRYTIQRQRFLYRYGLKSEDNGNPVDASEYTPPSVNSCVPRRAETNAMGEVTRWAWQCESIGQVHEDPFGEPTSIEQMEAFEDHRTAAYWTDSLLAPGPKRDAPIQGLRIPGSRTEAHTDNPQSQADRLSQQQVDDGTEDLLAAEVEMHLYIITVHFDDGSMARSYALVDGAPFADR